jgi:pimeloyl-ACP methyl ester carboxylesterase
MDTLISRRLLSAGLAAAIRLAGLTAALTMASLAPASAAGAAAPAGKPTVVLVHGAFAGSSSWNGVAAQLRSKGYVVLAAANPLRGVQSDARYVGSVVDSIPGRVVLVGHSYGGAVISNVTAAKGNIKALVYVAGFAPEVGESAEDLGGKFPGSTLGPTLAPPVPLPDGGNDLYIDQAKFHAQFAADLPRSQAELMAVTQRPITQAALKEASGQAAWKAIPSWFVYGSRDKNIPLALQPFMAKRAQAKKAVEVPGASHVVMVSHPEVVARLIEEAASASDE